MIRSVAAIPLNALEATDPAGSATMEERDHCEGDSVAKGDRSNDRSPFFVSPVVCRNCRPVTRQSNVRLRPVARSLNGLPLCYGPESLSELHHVQDWSSLHRTGLDIVFVVGVLTRLLLFLGDLSLTGVENGHHVTLLRLEFTQSVPHDSVESVEGNRTVGRLDHQYRVIAVLGGGTETESEDRTREDVVDVWTPSRSLSQLRTLVESLHRGNGSSGVGSLGSSHCEGSSLLLAYLDTILGTNGATVAHVATVTIEASLLLHREDVNNVSDVSYRPLNLGNTSDDDPQVLDSLVQSEATPPTPIVEPIVTPVLPEPRIPTRLLSVRQTVDPLWTQPTMILPADTRRKYLHIRCRATTGGTADDGVVITSELKSTGGLAFLNTANTTGLDLPHTGAVYATAIGTNPVLVDVWSVTE